MNNIIKKNPLKSKVISLIPILFLTLNVNSSEASDKGAFYHESCNPSYQKKYESYRFHGVWRKTNNDVIVRTGKAINRFFHEESDLKFSGYSISDYEVDVDNDGKRFEFDAVYKKGQASIHPIFRLDSADFSKVWQDLRKSGHVLVDLETFVISGKRKWAGIFEKRSEKSALWRNFNTEDFGKKRNEMAKQGLKLVDIEVHVVNNKPRWSGVWRQGKDGLLNRNYSLKQFDKMRINRRNNGYKLIDIETYKIKNKIYYAAIWEKSPEREYLNSFRSMCNLLKKHRELSDEGYELIDWERVKKP